MPEAGYSPVTELFLEGTLKKYKQMFWPILSVVLLAALAIVLVLAFGRPCKEWEAVAALGNWAAAVGTISAVLVALMLARREAEWRLEDRKEKAVRSQRLIASGWVKLEEIGREIGSIDSLLSGPEVFNQSEVVSKVERVSSLFEEVDFHGWEMIDSGLAAMGVLADVQWRIFCRLFSNSSLEGDGQGENISAMRKKVNKPLSIVREMLRLHPARRALRGS